MENTSLREQICLYVKETYQTEPEYLWNKFPGYAVFRHSDNNKWYGAVMNITKDKLGLNDNEMVDVLNVKVDDPFFASTLMQNDGYFKGYHFGRGNWISILLDGTVPFDEICGMIDTSYLATSSKKKKKTVRPPKEWLVPANPKYHDIEHIFDEADISDWKQGAGIRTGDTVYLYVGAPISAILYKCEVLETDIPYDYSDDKITVKAVMNLKLLKRYDPSVFTFALLKNEFGVPTVRGPRGVPHRLSAALNK